jgi:DNA replication protein DnaC
MMNDLENTIERLKQKASMVLFDEEDVNRDYLKRAWLSAIKCELRRTLGDECLHWDDSLCQDLPAIEQMERLNGGAFMIFGSMGSGKTTTAVHLMLAMAGHLADGFQSAGMDLPNPDTYAMAIRATKLFRRLSQLYGDAAEIGNALIERAEQAKILFVDDLGTEGGNDEACAAFFDIMDWRYQHRTNKITLICSNLTPLEWATYRDGRFLRLADRWRQDNHSVVLKGESVRWIEAVKEAR